MSLQVSNSPFSEQQVELLSRLLPTLTSEQTVWLSGYLAAMGGAAPGAAVGTAAPGGAASQTATAQGGLEVTVLYGSQTGNAATLAAGLSRRLTERGFQAHLTCMSDFKGRNLKKIERVLVIVSTHGEGAPPDKAVQFCEFLAGKRAPKVDGLQFSVLALGDITYAHFCKTGKDIDERLVDLGGARLADRVDCDVDYDERAETWMDSVLAVLGTQAEASGFAVPALGVGASATGTEPPRHGR